MIDMARRKPTFKSDRKTRVRHAAAMQQTSSRYFQKVAGSVHRGTSSSRLPETIVREFAQSHNGITLQGGWLAEISSQEKLSFLIVSASWNVSFEEKEAGGRKLLLARQQWWPSGGCVKIGRFKGT